MSHLRRTAAILCATLFGTVAASSAAQAHLAQNTAAEGDAQGRLVLVLDSSGSMAEDDAGGQTRIESARDALNTVVDTMPDDAVVGMRVFGASVFSKEDPGACEDSDLVVPVAKADKGALRDAIAAYEPYGETPIAYALQQAASDLGGEGPRTILLVSDGEATCDPDPCVVAEQLAAQGIELKIDVVGLNVEGAARDQLSCVADKGNGTYYDATDADDLVASIDTSAVRALQPFEATGTPIEGTPRYDGAPAMETGGQYLDTVPAVDTQKFYTVKRGSPGSNIVIGVSGRPEETDIYGQLELQLRTADGEDCMSSYPTATDGASYSLLAASVSTLSWFTPELDGPCATADELELSVRQNDGDDIVDTPIQIKLWEYGAVENYDALPEDVTDSDTSWVELTTQRDNPTPAAGAPSFAAATELAPGTTYTDTAVAGEMRIFKVPVEWGQRLQAQVNTDPPTGAWAADVDPTATIEIALYGPAGAWAVDPSVAGTSASAGVGDPDGATAQASTVEVRYRNHESPHDFGTAAAISGDYYIGVAVPADPEGDAYEVPFALTTTVEGEAGTGEPTFSEVKLPGDDTSGDGEDEGQPSDDGSPTPSDEGDGEPDADGTQPLADDSQGSGVDATTVAIGVGGVVLLLLGAFGINRWIRTRA